MMRFHLCWIVISGFLWQCPLYAAAPDSLSRREFIRLMDHISEPAGEFHSDNLVSNESSYLHPMSVLRRVPVQGGVYIGVAPEQNFSYIAEIKPHIAFILDIRRDNMLQHLMFKALFSLADTRTAFLSRLLSKPVWSALPWWRRLFKTRPDWVQGAREPSVRELVDYFDGVSADPGLFRANLERIQSLVRACGVTTPEDLRAVERIYRAFYTRQLDIRYDLRTEYGTPLFQYPVLRDLLLATTLEGEPANFLSSAASFETVKELQRRNLIVPVVGDFSGPAALRRIAAYARAHEETISAFYTSNVEFYLWAAPEHDVFARYVENVRRLPITERSVFIRAYHNDHHTEHLSHPQRVGSLLFTTVVQPIGVFLEDQDRCARHPGDPAWRGFQRYFRLVTVGLLK